MKVLERQNKRQHKFR